MARPENRTKQRIRGIKARPAGTTIAMTALALFMFGIGALILLMPSTVFAAWTEPGSNPPLGNVAAPLNVSANAQTKAGPLGALAPESNVANQITWGINGVGGKATVSGNNYSTSAGVYGISSTDTNGVGQQIGLLGVAKTNGSNSFGVYGWDESGLGNAYAGYFAGKVGIAGNICWNGDCRSGWGEITGTSIFTWDEPNKIIKPDTKYQDSSFAVGGTTSANAAFFVQVNPGSPATSTVYSNGSLVLGEPTGGATSDGICTRDERCTSADCYGKPATQCLPGDICNTNGDDSCADKAAPSVPSNLVLTPTLTTVALSWTDSVDIGSSGLKQYHIFRCTGLNCVIGTVNGKPDPAAQVGTTATHSFSNTGLDAGTHYTYEVTAEDNANNTSAPSVAVPVTTQTDSPPAVPTGLSVKAVGGTTVTMQWTKSAEADVAGYRLYRCADQTCAQVTQVGGDVAQTDTPSAQDTGLAGTTTYYYNVVAFDNADPQSLVSLPSSAVPATTTAVAPAPPVSLTVVSTGQRQASLSWVPEDPLEPSMTGFNVYRCSTADCGTVDKLITTDKNTTSYIDTNLRGNATYYYQIASHDGGNPQLESTHIPTTPVAASIPLTVPTGLTLASICSDGTKAQVTLQWTAVDDNDMAGYHLYGCEGASCTNTTLQGTTQATSLLVTGLNLNSTYRYQVSTYSNAGRESGKSSPLYSVATKSLRNCGGNSNGPIPLGATTVPNATFARAEVKPLIAGVRPLAHLLSVPVAQAAQVRFAAASTQGVKAAGGPSSSAVRLTINNGGLTLAPSSAPTGAAPGTMYFDSGSTPGKFLCTADGTTWTNCGGGSSGVGSAISVTDPITKSGDANNVTLGLATPLSVTFGGTGTTAFAKGSLVFAGDSGVYTQDNNNLFWDATNQRLGIGTATPQSQLELSGSYVSPYGGVGRYENLSRYSEDFSASFQWLQNGATVAPGQADGPDGSALTADKVSFINNGFLIQNIIVTNGQKYTVSVWARTETGTDAFQLFFNNNGTITYSGDLALTTTWKRYAWTFTGGGSGGTQQVGLASKLNSASAGLFWGYQMATGTSANVYVRTDAALVTARPGVVSDGISVITGAADTTLTKTWSPSLGNNLALNLANANTWTAQQKMDAGLRFGSGTGGYSYLNTSGNLSLGISSGKARITATQPQNINATGLVTINAGDTAVLGNVSTRFTTEIFPGNTIQIGGNGGPLGIVQSVDDDRTLHVASAFTSSLTNVAMIAVPNIVETSMSSDSPKFAITSGGSPCIAGSCLSDWSDLIMNSRAAVYNTITDPSGQPADFHINGTGTLKELDATDQIGINSKNVNNNYTYFVGNSAQTLGSNITYTLPAIAPASNQVLAATTGGNSATLGWVNATNSTSFQATAGTGGATQNLLVKYDPNNQNTVILPAASDKIGAVGVALATVSAGQSVAIQTQGFATAVADNAVTAGHYIGMSTIPSATAGRVIDLGASYPTVAGIQVIGIAQTAATQGNTFTLALNPLDNVVASSGIGGSIGDNQIAYGNPADSGKITGNANLVYSGGNVGIGASQKLSRLTVQQASDVVNVGGTTTANASTTINGTGTSFLTKIGVGDRIALSSAASTYATVTAINTDLQLTVDAPLGNGTSQTINVKHSIVRFDDAAPSTKFVLNDLGNVGIGTVTPDANYKLTTANGGVKADANIANQPAGYFNNSSQYGYGILVQGRSAITALTETRGLTDVAAGAAVSGTGSPNGNGPTFHGNADYWKAAVGQTLVIDLGSAISQVKAVSFGTYFRESPDTVPNSYHIAYSTDNVTYTDFVAPVTGNTQPSVIYYNTGLNGVTARYIRITVDATNLTSPSQIAGVQVLSQAGSAHYGDRPFSIAAGGDNVVLTTGGNVGVGATTPQRKLDVSGDAVIASRGVEKVVNGDFATNSAWSYGANWTYDAVNKEADHASGVTVANLSEDVSAVANEIYLVTYDVKNWSSGTVVPAIGGVSGMIVSANGTYTQVLQALSTGSLTFTPSSNFIGSIDNVSVKKISGNLGVGTTSPIAGLDVRSSIDATSGAAVGANLAPVMRATNNFDTLTGVSLIPSFNDNAKSNVSHYSLFAPGGKPSQLAVRSITQGPKSVVLQGRYAYVAESGGYLEVFDVSRPADATTWLVNSAPISYGVFTFNDIAVSGQYAYVLADAPNSGDQDQLFVFDVTNPKSPAKVGAINLGVNVTPRAIAVQGRFAYIITSTDNKLYIVNISDPLNPKVVSASGTTTGAVPYDIAVQGNYAYIVTNSGNTVERYNVADPGLVATAGSTSTIVSGNEGKNPTAISIQGRYAYILTNNTTNSFYRLQIYDIADTASNPARKANIATENGPVSLSTQGQYAYVVNSGSSTLQRFDITDALSPTVVGTSAATSTVPLGIAVQGRYAFLIIAGVTEFDAYDLSGVYIQPLEAGSLESGTLSVRTDSRIGNDLDVRGGITAARGIASSGSIAASTGGNGADAISGFSSNANKSAIYGENASGYAGYFSGKVAIQASSGANKKASVLQTDSGQTSDITYTFPTTTPTGTKVLTGAVNAGAVTLGWGDAGIGTITGVTPGTGLTGGGNSGNVTVGLINGGLASGCGDATTGKLYWDGTKLVCGTDQTIGSGSGITSLNGLTAGTQTFNNDTNVTITSPGGGSVHNLGWSGTLALTRGGTNASLTAVNGGIVYSDASKLAILGTGTSGYCLQTQGANNPPKWGSCGSGLPSGSTNQTLRHNGTSWVADSFLSNTGSVVGIGSPTSPTEALELGSTKNIRLNINAGSDNQPGNASYQLASREDGTSGQSRIWKIYSASSSTNNGGVEPNGFAIWDYPAAGGAAERFTIAPSVSGIGTSVARIDQYGNFGLGSWAPASKLDVYGGGLSATTYYETIITAHQSGTTLTVDSAERFQKKDVGKIFVWDNSLYKAVRITWVPDAPGGSTNATVDISQTVTSHGVAGAPAGYVRKAALYADANTANTTKVGIGTSSPSELLTLRNPDLAWDETSGEVRMKFDSGNGGGAVGFSKETANTGGLSFYTQYGYGDSYTYERMRISAIGNVGIGQAGPLNTLVLNSVDSGKTISGSPTGDSTNAVGFYANKTGSALYVQQDNTSGYAVYASGGKNYFGGNVGIGQASPGAKLTINNPTTANKYGSSTDALYSFAQGGVAISADQGDINSYAVYANGGKNYFSGNVGIGTTLPVANLDVYSPTVGNSGSISVTKNTGRTYANAGKSETTVSTGGTPFFNSSDVGKLLVWANGSVDTIVTYNNDSNVIVNNSGNWSSIAMTVIDTTLVATSSGNVGIGLAGPASTLVVNKGLLATNAGDSANAVSFIGSSANSTLYAEQQNNSGYAGYFSGKVKINGTNSAANVFDIQYNGSSLVTAAGNGTLTLKPIPPPFVTFGGVYGTNWFETLFANNTSEAASTGGTPFAVLGGDSSPLSTNGGTGLLVGGTSQFSEINVTIQQAAVANSSLTLYFCTGTHADCFFDRQYLGRTYDGSVSDTTNTFSRTGKISWTIPAGWQQETVNGQNMYWILITVDQSADGKRTGCSGFANDANYCGQLYPTIPTVLSMLPTLSNTLEYAIQSFTNTTDSSPSFSVNRAGTVSAGSITTSGLTVSGTSSLSNLSVSGDASVAGYLMASKRGGGAPPAADCDSQFEFGRIYIDTLNNRLYVCNESGTSRGWDYIALTN